MRVATRSGRCRQTVVRSAVSASASPTSSTPVVIAGAGIVGASTAFFLSSEHDTSVVLIDSTHPAASASGKAGGFLASSWSDGTPTQELARKGFALHRAWSEHEFLDVDYRFGIDAVSGMLGVPGDYRFIGSDRRGCGQVHPEKLTLALVDRIVAMGGSVRSSTMLSEVLLEDGGEAGMVGKRVVGVRVETDDGEEVIETRQCVVALGAWTSLTLKSACNAAYQAMNPEVVGHKVHSIVVKDVRAEGKQESTSLFLQDGETGADPEAYPRPDGTMYVCGNQGGRAYDSIPPRLAREVCVEEDGSAEYLRSVSSVLLETGEVDVRVQQACYLPVSSSNRPVISKVPGIDGLYINAGHSCWGILQGPVSGRAMAELLATGRSSCIDLKPFSL